MWTSKYKKNNLSQCHFVQHTNPTWTGLGLNTVFSVERFAMTRVSHGTSKWLALWLVSKVEGRLSTCDLWAVVASSVPRSPASAHRTVQIYRPVNWFNRKFLWNLRCLATCVLRRSVFYYAVVMWTGGWEGHIFGRARPELTCTASCNISSQKTVEQNSSFSGKNWICPVPLFPPQSP